jgi:hypothetical protein
MCPNPGCAKKFSRVDNLNQHIRVHAKGGSSGSASPRVRKARRAKADDVEDSVSSLMIFPE